MLQSGWSHGGWRKTGRKAMTKAGKGKEEVCLGDKPVRGNSLKREQGKDIACPHHPLSLHLLLGPCRPYHCLVPGNSDH